MSTVCVVAVRPNGYGEVLLDAQVRPADISPPVERSGSKQLILLQLSIQKNFQKFLNATNILDANFRQPYSAEGLRFLTSIYNAYDMIVDDEHQSLTIFSRSEDVRFMVSSEAFSLRVRKTIRRNAGYDPQWFPYGMKTILVGY
ncbi:hypothetical protein [Methylobacterium sp. Leaf125]|uniref:hypothetical protein n=1 Tax=Methylobacterium sp. Leaf125 TaxID=1736265 RepID=UPI000A6D6DED|nr:hypothetical protein [Methylobacterium sp. Leaf125]